MAKAIYNKDGSVTYRSKTFHVGDRVVVHRDMGQGLLVVGKTVRIVKIDSDETVRCIDNDSEYWWVHLRGLFEYSEEDEPHQAQPERKPWEMPELKPWMRVVNHLGTYIIAEVDGVLTGLRVGGCESIEYLKESAEEIYAAPLHHDGTIARYQALDTEHKGELLWTHSEAETLRQDYETKEARKAEIQAEIDKLKAQLEAIS